MRTLLTAYLLTLTCSFAMAANPYMQSDDTWISISGTVDSVSPDEFILDYDDGMITVEMDDGDRDADAYVLDKGDKVTVTGKIDDDFFETTTIEASSVYIENINTYFYSSSIDEEDAYSVIATPLTMTDPIVVSETMIEGTVTQVFDEEFTLDTGLTEFTVETEEMGYDPLDDVGYQQIDVGDRVVVSGNIDYDLFEGRDFVAETITTLYE